MEVSGTDSPSVDLRAVDPERDARVKRAAIDAGVRQVFAARALPKDPTAEELLEIIDEQVAFWAARIEVRFTSSTLRVAVGGDALVAEWDDPIGDPDLDDFLVEEIAKLYVNDLWIEFPRP